MKKHITSVMIGVVIVLVLILYLVTFTVRYQEKALVLTVGGKIGRQVDEAGLHWIWPGQKVEKFDARIHTLQGQATQTMTRDAKSIIVTVYVNWRIVDAKTFYLKFSQGKGSGSEDVVRYAEESLRGLISNAINVFTEYRFNELVTLDRDAFKLAEVERNDDGPDGMLERIRRDVASADYGVEILDVGIKQLGVPDSVTAVVFARMIAERQTEIKRLTVDGEGLAASIVGRAKIEASETKDQAEAKARKIEGLGDAEAAEHYANFLEHPSLADFLRKLDTLRKTLSEQTTIVIDADSPAFNMILEGPNVSGEADRKWLEGVNKTVGDNQ